MPGMEDGRHPAHQHAVTRHMAETLAPQPALDSAMKTPTKAGLNGPSRYTARTAKATERTASEH